jgi:hypothetical protein
MTTNADPFHTHLERGIREALSRISSAETPDIYVVSLFVYDENDDPAKPTVTVGYNTEQAVADTTPQAWDEGEARWNYAFWLQNELSVLADSGLDPVGASLRDDWTFRVDGDDAGNIPDESPPITWRFVELLIDIVRELHADGTISRVFGQSIPVLIHELEYYDLIAAQNRQANPDGLADAFCAWVLDDD